MGYEVSDKPSCKATTKLRSRSTSHEVRSHHEVSTKLRSLSKRTKFSYEVPLMFIICCPTRSCFKERNLFTKLTELFASFPTKSFLLKSFEIRTKRNYDISSKYSELIELLGTPLTLQKFHEVI